LSADRMLLSSIWWRMCPSCWMSLWSNNRVGRELWISFWVNLARYRFIAFLFKTKKELRCKSLSPRASVIGVIIWILCRDKQPSLSNSHQLWLTNQEGEMILSTPLRSTVRQLWSSQRRLFSVSASLPVELSYQLIEPPSSQETKRNGHPIVFMHGLFGSKRNNRSISKYVFPRHTTVSLLL
jgi:hypothetical protein